MKQRRAAGSGSDGAGEPRAERPEEAAAAPPRPEREDARALTVVGIGGSAGGIAALKAFFGNVPGADGGSSSAYVVVLHLSPDHESHLAELLARSTSLPVRQVTGTVRVEPGHVYVIPPAKHLEMADGALRLRDPEPGQRDGTRVAVDTFFQTLAAAHGPQAAAVILSGSGADGTLGLKQVKEAGGLVVAQSPIEAEYDSMPRSAIATGLVDYVLPAGDMPARIAAYWEASWRMRLPREAAPSPEQREEGPDQEKALREILAHVRARTGHDFALYKRATVLRRIGRRLQVNGLPSLPAYRDFVASHPAEAGDLVKDLLISVTQFFRDPEAWGALARDALPRLLREREQGPQDDVRAWVCGCATGEEAYTLAMLLLEATADDGDDDHRPPRVQVFATDMDSDAVARARAGLYPETIAADVNGERLRRWFYRQNGGVYQVGKELREAVLFATHDVLRDTPFSRLDLVTCRNLLIYLNRDAQDRVFETFHYALRPHGRLLLGASESAGGGANLFGVADKQHRIHARLPVARGAAGAPPAGGGVSGPARWAVGSDLAAVVPSRPAAPPAAALPAARRPAAGGRELLLSLMERYGPPTALVDEAYDLVHLSNGAGRFLRVADGEPTRNLLELVHPDLRLDLRATLYAAAVAGADQAQVVERGDAEPPGAAAVRLTVRPVEDAPDGARPGRFFLVQFEDLPGAAEGTVGLPESPASAARDGDARDPDLTRHLEGENAALQRELRATIEQHDAITEELKASNEELQSMNEELRSVAEELETSKEELQSMNEELTTVNHELKSRVDEVIRVNGDLQNFLASTAIATLFLDRELRIQRYTPAAESLFNLIPTDVGRPLSDLTGRLDYPALSEDAARVLERLLPAEREVATAVADGGGNRGGGPGERRRHFLARLLPYRSLDDRIEGVVVNFVDVTERRKAQEALRASEEQFRRAVEEAPVPMILHAEDGEVLQVSRAWTELTGYALPDVPTLDAWLSRAAYGEGADALRDHMRDLFRVGVGEDGSGGESESEQRSSTPATEFEIRTRQGGRRLWSFSASSPGALRDGRRFVVGMAVDVTERRRAEEALGESEARLRTLSDAVPQVIWTNAADGTADYFNRRWYEYTGLTYEESAGPGWQAVVHTDDAPASKEAWQQALAAGATFEAEYRLRGADGSYRWFLGRNVPLRDASGRVAGWFGSATDVQELRELRAGLEARVGERTRSLEERTAELRGALSALEAALSERQALLSRVVTAQEEERRRISRELHDEMGQLLTGFALGLYSLEGAVTGHCPPDAGVGDTLSKLRSLAADMGREVYRVAVELRPTALDDLGLVPALESYVQQWTERTGVPAEFAATGLDGDRHRRLPPLVETVVYRVVQEALTNAAKYAAPAGATRVSVTLQRRKGEGGGGAGEGGAEVLASVGDDGPGFDVGEAARRGRLGVAGMRERAELAGGTLEVESAPGEGTTVYLRLPAEPAAAVPPVAEQDPDDANDDASDAHAA